MGQNNAFMQDLKAKIEAGINPFTNKPIRINGETEHLKSDIKRQLRIVDEQDAINRFTWYNLPEGLNSRLLERVLYYRGQGIFFKLEEKFYFLPYALNGTIDVYGRYLGVSPLPFNGTSNDGEPEKPWINGLIYDPVYEVAIPEDFYDKSEEEITNFLNRSCVIIRDYTEQISQKSISRQILNDPLLGMMAECFPFMRTALLNSTGVNGMRVVSESDSQNVYAANSAIRKAALEGDKSVPIVGEVDFQELTSGNVSKAEEFLLAMQSMDNYRLSLFGLKTGGILQKKAHMLQSEQDTNAGNTGLVMRDSLQNRQDACNIINSIWGLDIWCEPSETVIEVDLNGDGLAGSNEDMGTNQGAGEETENAYE